MQDLKVGDRVTVINDEGFPIELIGRKMIITSIELNRATKEYVYFAGSSTNSAQFGFSRSQLQRN